MRRISKAPLAVLAGLVMVLTTSLVCEAEAESIELADMIVTLREHFVSLLELEQEIRGMYVDCRKRIVSNATVKSEAPVWEARLEDMREELESLGDTAHARATASLDNRERQAWRVARSCTFSLGQAIFNLRLAISNMDLMTLYARATSTRTWEWQSASDQCYMHLELAMVRLETSAMVCDMMLMEIPQATTIEP